MNVLGAVKGLTLTSSDKKIPLTEVTGQSYQYEAKIGKGKSVSLKPVFAVSGYGAGTQAAYRSSDTAIATVKNGKVSVQKNCASGSVFYILAVCRDGVHYKYVKFTVQ